VRQLWGLRSYRKETLVLWSNAGFVAALPIGIHSDSILVGGGGIKSHSLHRLVGLPEAFSARASRIHLRGFRWYRNA
jgi:hypothetical protein